MAVGVPVVATRISGIPELVRHEESGLLAEHSDAASLRGMLIRALEDLDAWDARLEAARATTESTFDVRREAERIAGLLRDAAGVGSA
jgi:glycosyltransferase involved in cell wall biosynthesis